MAESKLTPHLDAIKVALDAGRSFPEIARELGFSKSTVRDFCYARGLASKSLGGAKPPPMAGDGAEVSREEKLDAECRELRSQLRKARTSDVNVERVLDMIRAALEDSGPTLWTAPVLEASGPVDRAHVQALMVSDTHAGELVDPAMIDGMNEYNWDVLEERMAGLLKAVLSYKDHRPYPIAELWVPTLGDMVGGSHHEELMATNEFPVAEQAVRFGKLYGSFIEGLVPHYPRIVVPTVNGNHGRVDKKISAKLGFNSFDWITYEIAAAATQQYSSVEWRIARADRQVVEIAGLNILLLHGHGIRSSMPGVPWGGVQRRVNELTKLYLQRNIAIDYVMCGHFHDPNVAGKVMMNGSVKGEDEWAIANFGSGSRPTQLLVTFDPRKKRRTDVSYINL